MGDSLVVVGGDGRYRVHLHTDDADGAVEMARRAGSAEGVRVVDLEEQVAEGCVAGQARAVRMGARQTTGLVVIARGDGIAALFRSLGAEVVAGAEVDEVVAAVSNATTGAVVVLPTDERSFSLAERVPGETGKDVWVVYARSIPEALSAAAAFNPTESPNDAAERMAEVIDTVATASLRKSDGAWIGTIDGEMAANDPDLGSAAIATLTGIRTDEHEILTVLVGSDAVEPDTERLTRALASGFADLQIETHRGGQPGDPYVFGLE
jgi:dihydroxyacetone kinase-like predicted kinase